MLKFIIWVKTYFLYIISIVIALCLIGVAIYSCNESKNQKIYDVTYSIYCKDTVTKSITTVGYPRLERFKNEWRLSDYNGEILNSHDSICLNRVVQK